MYTVALSETGFQEPTSVCHSHGDKMRSRQLRWGVCLSSAGCLRRRPGGAGAVRHRQRRSQLACFPSSANRAKHRAPFKHGPCTAAKVKSHFQRARKNSSCHCSLNFFVFKSTCLNLLLPTSDSGGQTRDLMERRTFQKPGGYFLENMVP